MAEQRLGPLHENNSILRRASCGAAVLRPYKGLHHSCELEL
jgi:hypothetical protein